VDPEEQSLVVYVLKNDEYVASTYEATDTVRIAVLPGCAIDLAGIFKGLHKA
jgi:hypothetical protein